MYSANQQHDYIIHYNNKQWETQATSSYEAQQKGIKHFKPPKSKEHLVYPFLANQLIDPASL